jgi:hypothetical protein
MWRSPLSGAAIDFSRLNHDMGGKASHRIGERFALLDF